MTIDDFHSRLCRHLEVNLFAWPLFLFFGHRLNKRVPL
jgi:hypothetical protein